MESGQPRCLECAQQQASGGTGRDDPQDAPTSRMQPVYDQAVATSCILLCLLMALTNG